MGERLAMKRWMVTADRDSVRTIRLALRWMLILATAMLLTPPDPVATPSRSTPC